MALAPKFAGQAFSANVSPKTIHTVELYLDYVCPFSKKMFDTVYETVLPAIREKYPAKVELIFRQQIQPWHPSSTLVHEAGAAVLRLAPDQFWRFSQALFAKQTEYFDVNVVNERRNETYQRLAKVAAEVGIKEADFVDLLQVPDKPGEGGALNVGNKVTDDIKQLVKFNRRVGVHVTPTVLFNGIEEGSISSSFTGQQWLDWLDKNIK